MITRGRTDKTSMTWEMGVPEVSRGRQITMMTSPNGNGLETINLCDLGEYALYFLILYEYAVRYYILKFLVSSLQHRSKYRNIKIKSDFRK